VPSKSPRRSPEINRTYVDDVVEAIVRLVDRPPQGNPAWSGADPDASSSAALWKIYNIGNNRPEELMHVVALLEKEFGRPAIKEMLPMQPGDVPATYADIRSGARRNRQGRHFHRRWHCAVFKMVS
jgi:UDP-glucuronate 4-epimerase